MSEFVLELGAQPGFHFPHARVNPAPVEVVLLPQLLAIRGIHLVEPLHEVVRNLVAEGIVEPSGQPGGDRHGRLEGS
jgi:hypothetical protein